MRRVTAIRRAILKWHQKIERDLPWKEGRDPYKIWLSEIIMQQTRVEQGTPYYLRFVEAYPDVSDLAAAEIDEVMKLWQGLGYYRRAQHMHQAARSIVDKHNGIFPDTYQEILDLKGVGPYTAAAISSFAFGLPHAVLDGNVIRVISRLEGITEPISTNTVQKHLKQTAAKLLDEKAPGDFNQAMMDFGSLHCSPHRPSCKTCPCQVHCQAFQKNLVSEIPKKKAKKPKRIRFFYYILVNDVNNVWLRKRPSDDIWAGLYEFVLVEKSKKTNWSQILKEVPYPLELLHVSAERKHELSHQTIVTAFAETNLLEPTQQSDYLSISRSTLSNYPYSRVMDWYLSDKAVTLNLQF